jgi:hypothetical protein
MVTQNKIEIMIFSFLKKYVTPNVSPSFQLWICLDIHSYFLLFSRLIHSPTHPVIQQSDPAIRLLTTLGNLWDADILICCSSKKDPAHFNYVIKIPYVLSTTHTRTAGNQLWLNTFLTNVVCAEKGWLASELKMCKGVIISANYG